MWFLGARASSGYREYKNEQDTYRNDVTALIFVPLCQAATQAKVPSIPQLCVRSDRAGDGDTVEIACFHVGQTWFGFRSTEVVEAVEHVGMTGVPGAGSDFAGYLMYQGVPIPVFDIRNAANAGAACENIQRQVIVLKKGINTHFGILADGLGEMPEVHLSRLQELPNLLAGGNVLAESIVVVESSQKENLLVVLSVNRIASRLVAVTDSTELVGAE